MHLISNVDNFVSRQKNKSPFNTPTQGQEEPILMAAINANYVLADLASQVLTDILPNRSCFK